MARQAGLLGAAAEADDAAELPQALPRAFFLRPALEVAPELVGVELLFEGAGGRIVEVEAYDEAEPASHAFGGKTERNRTMFGPAGLVYVYRSYGIHWCMNVVCEDGRASAVLIRALEPLWGIDAMSERRSRRTPRELCSGPGKLCQALGVSGEHDGAHALEPPFSLRRGRADVDVVASPRVGISKATELPWRFSERGSVYVSKPLPR